jgi:dTDP-4-dehydrorhamnose 3,5-epimerase
MPAAIAAKSSLLDLRVGNGMSASLDGILVVEPKVFGDARGFFLERYNRREMAKLGVHAQFVQDNHSYSVRNVLRGLHYQTQHPQGKLIRVVVGEILDVVVDLRKGSPTLGRWSAMSLSGENRRMLWIPPGFAHGFRVVSAEAHVLYKTTDFYAPEHERTLAWNDPDLKIEWQLDGEPLVSTKDQHGVRFREAEKFD